jgi:hypothetical protein
MSVYVGVQVEVLAQGYVDGSKTRPDRRGQRPFQAEPVPFDGIQRLLREEVVTVLRGDETRFLPIPFDRRARRLEDLDYRLGDRRPDPIARDERDRVRHQPSPFT